MVQQIMKEKKLKFGIGGDIVGMPQTKCKTLKVFMCELMYTKGIFSSSDSK